VSAGLFASPSLNVHMHHYHPSGQSGSRTPSSHTSTRRASSSSESLLPHKHTRKPSSGRGVGGGEVNDTLGAVIVGGVTSTRTRAHTHAHTYTHIPRTSIAPALDSVVASEHYDALSARMGTPLSPARTSEAQQVRVCVCVCVCLYTYV
jgi:hypothetical protein